jgi:hypothetical protein
MILAEKNETGIWREGEGFFVESEIFRVHKMIP